MQLFLIKFFIKFYLLKLILLHKFNIYPNLVNRKIYQKIAKRRRSSKITKKGYVSTSTLANSHKIRRSHLVNLFIQEGYIFIDSQNKETLTFKALMLGVYYQSADEQSDRQWIIWPELFIAHQLIINFSRKH
ncbi:MAG: hypothetical protein PHH41_02475 [Sulfurimonas sp.]|nr:hypothetical protein [Sulfurimonas sp.]MDD3061006.1 hypothetical protein [Sulfurimonas sp.]MDD5201987.1 hypothetical protein [Sulfurimonas sp.]